MRDRFRFVTVLAGMLVMGGASRMAGAQQLAPVFAPGSIVPGRGALPNPDSVLVLADRYLADATKHADQADTRIFRQVQASFRRLEANPDTGVQVTAQAGGAAGPVSAGKTVTYGQSGATTATNVSLALGARTKDDQPQIDSILTSKFAQEFDLLAVGQQAVKDLSLPRP